ncbi:GFA family protein [Pseudooceanicola sp. C21-150M6]|uniref:GFA family protein n=1 Tax=Pseudooceanicola sp. C21-150M6 TaxID=3434355 RepID=UPI003D7F787A
MQGQCNCGAVRYTLTVAPIVTHACHCTWCQRETGAAFAVNAVVERSAITLDAGAPVATTLASQSGRGQIVQRCAACGVTLWSHYAQSGPAIAFLRVGTLDPDHDIVPDVHIYTSTRRPWLPLPEATRVFEEFYNPREVWGEEGLSRFADAREAYKAEGCA